MHTTSSLASALPRRYRHAAAIAVGAALLAACGGDADIAEPAAVATTVASAPPAAEPAVEPSPDAAVKISQTLLGDVLADADGMTLYAFTNDVEAQSTCYGTCAEAWPPVLVAPDFIVSPGLDSGIFATTVRDDGATQLVAGKFPLYRFAADSKPGDVTGQTSGDVWFAVDLQGRIIESPLPEVGGEQAEGGAEPTEPVDIGPVVGLADTDLGQVVSDTDGFVLYLFLPDEAGEPTCAGGCAGVWPPLLVEGGIELLADAGIDSSLLSTVPHPDGGTQLKIGKWPLYYFAADEAAGQTNGQASGGEWFVVAADGTPIR